MKLDPIRPSSVYVCDSLDNGHSKKRTLANMVEKLRRSTDCRARASEGEIYRAALKLACESDSHSDYALGVLDSTAAVFGFKEARLGQHAKPHAAFPFNQDDVA